MVQVAPIYSDQHHEQVQRLKRRNGPLDGPNEREEYPENHLLDSRGKFNGTIPLEFNSVESSEPVKNNNSSPQDTMQK